MDDYLKHSLELVKAQAGVRTMSEEEISSMVQNIFNKLKSLAEGVQQNTEDDFAHDPKKAIREKSISCCVCGRTFKIITKKHLASHDLTPEEYREKFGYKKGTPLVCKSLQKERRKKMHEMKIWEKVDRQK